jgi:uncharacterized protein YutE (UPF0331/DUF86 family)
VKEDYKTLLKASVSKLISAINLVTASLEDLDYFDVNRKYSPKELEPYDALCDRFIRAVEACIKFFKTYNYYLNTVSAETYRDLLLNMEKLKIISSVGIWIDMRDIRNRVVHDYLPHQIKEIYDLIMGEFKDELLLARQKIETVEKTKL